MLKIWFLSYTPTYYLGNSDIASIVVNESEAEGEEARTFLEEVRVTFPQVCNIKLSTGCVMMISCARS